MGTVKGVNQTLKDAGGLASQIAAGLDGGRVKVKIDSYVAAGSETAGTVIKFFGDLPEGAKIVAIVLSASVAQSSLTAQIGDSVDAARYAAAGNTTLQAALTAWIEHGQGYAIGTTATDGQIIVTTGGATMTAGTIYAAVLYTTD